jgi:aryl-alcohol dehydrogenase-like predicted oxidoreductase
VKISRREAIKAGAGTAVALGASATLHEALAQSRGMIKKVIPSSGEMVTSIGIGTNRYGLRPGEDRTPLRDTMARFVELGGQVMDTAAVYGTSEEVIGELATGLGIRDQLFYITKTAIFGEPQGAAGLEAAFDRMQTEVMDAFLVHNFNNIGSELPVMREWQQDGRIRYLGVSTSQDNQHALMIDLLEKEDVQVIEVNYSLGDREAAQRVLPLAQDKGVAVICNVPFGGSGQTSLFDVVEGSELPGFAADFGAESWGQFFLKYIISHPAVTVAIPGTRQVSHVEDNIGAAMGRLPDAAERLRMEAWFDSL